MNIMSFSHNWNRKLDCISFTTLRLHNDKYKAGDKWAVQYKHSIKPFWAQIVEKRVIRLEDINEFMARIDTGYDAYECRNILRTMYKNKGINWATQKLDFILMSYTNEVIDQNHKLFQS